MSTVVYSLRENNGEGEVVNRGDMLDVENGMVRTQLKLEVGAGEKSEKVMEKRDKNIELRK